MVGSTPFRKESKLRMDGKLGWALVVGLLKCSAEELTPSNNEEPMTVSRKTDMMRTVF